MKLTRRQRAAAKRSYKQRHAWVPDNTMPVYSTKESGWQIAGEVRPIRRLFTRFETALVVLCVTITVGSAALTLWALCHGPR